MPSSVRGFQVASIPVTERSFPFLRVATPEAQAPITPGETELAITVAIFSLDPNVSARVPPVEDL